MKIFTGKVIKTKDKTAVVEVERVVTHAIYGKKMKKSRKYQVHDEIGMNVNDLVNFVACRPYSKTKKWEIYIEEKEVKGKGKK